MRNGRLFGEFDSYSVNEHFKKQLRDELRSLSESKLKGTNIDDWVKYYVDKYYVNVPKLLKDGIEGSVRDVELNARHFHDRFAFFDDDSNRYIPTPGTEVSFTVPYQGDKQFFRCSGNTVYASFPDAEITDDHLIFTYQTIDHAADKINSDFDKDLEKVESHLQSLEGIFREFNNSIDPTVRQILSEKLTKFQKDIELASKLKYPLKKREDVAATYKVPEIKRVVVPRPIPAQNVTTPPDPILEMEHYDHILGIVKNMVRVMECSPTAFMELDEEDLRFHFLVQLNGQYEEWQQVKPLIIRARQILSLNIMARIFLLLNANFGRAQKAT